MKSRSILFAVAASVAVAASRAQEYGDYGDNYQDYVEGGGDGLYANYAEKQQDKAVGAAGGPSLTKLLMMGGVGWLAGAKIHSGRAMKKIQLVHKSEQKKLYTQYYNDVYKLQQSNAELEEYIQQLSDAIQSVDKEAALEQIQRDYDEFSQPDIDGDDRISRAEFNMYIKDYLSNYPNLEPEDYPRFDEFDHDGDGFISFKEYAEQMALIVQKAEKKTKSF